MVKIIQVGMAAWLLDERGRDKKGSTLVVILARNGEGGFATARVGDFKLFKAKSPDELEPIPEALIPQIDHENVGKLRKMFNLPTPPSI